MDVMKAKIEDGNQFEMENNWVLFFDYSSKN